jgi:TolA-binding protein
MTRLPGDPSPRRLTEGGAADIGDEATAAMLSRLRPRFDDDLALERNWRRIALARAPTRARRRIVVAAFAVGLAVVLGSAVVNLRRVIGRPVAAELVATSGGVFFSRRAETWQPGASGQGLAEGERLRTDATGRVLIRAPGIAAVLVDTESDVAFEQLAGGTFLRLARGSVVARVSKRPAGEPFVILTDRYAVRVVGTLFSVAQRPDDSVEVSVREGTVAVLEGSAEIARLTANTRWSSDGAVPSPAAVTDDAVVALLQSTLVGAAPASWSREELDRIAQLRGSTPLYERGSPAAAIERSARAQDATDRPATKSIAGVRPSRFVGAGSRIGPAPSPTFAPPPEAKSPGIGGFNPIPAHQVEESAFARALRLEAEGQDLRAAEEFARAVDLDSAHAELALYSLGRLKLRRLTDPQGALGAFRRYQEKYPEGALRPEVDLSVMEIEATLGQRAEALTESDHFLSSYPQSERVKEVRLLRANLLRAGGDCVSALREYGVLPDVELGDEGAYAVAYCHGELGDRAAAKRALQTYLTRFPSGSHGAEARRALNAMEREF